MTDGVGLNESQVYAGQFDTAYWGVNVDREIIVLRERYLVDEGAIAFLVWSRGDLAIPRPGACAIESGIDA